MANIIDSLTYGSTTGVFTLPYAVCSTAAATAAKVVSTGGNFALEVGASVRVRFSGTNTAANPTLNVNSTGAKAIYYKNYPVPIGMLKNQGIYDFVYNGSYWIVTSAQDESHITMLSAATEEDLNTYGDVTDYGRREWAFSSNVTKTNILCF